MEGSGIISRACVTDSLIVSVVLCDDNKEIRTGHTNSTTPEEPCPGISIRNPEKPSAENHETDSGQK